MKKIYNLDIYNNNNNNSNSNNINIKAADTIVR